MKLQELRDILDAVIEEYGGDKTIHVPDVTDPYNEEEGTAFYPAEVVFNVREGEDTEGNVNAQIAIMIYGLQNDA